MQKSISFIFMFLFFGANIMTLSAQKVALDSAKEKAFLFFSRSGSVNSAVKKTSRKTPQLKLANDRDEFYVFNDEANGGYVVISGDVRMPEVLGYSYEGRFDGNSIPCNMQAWLEDYAKQIDFLRTNPNTRVTKRTNTSRENISPMLTCWFHQGYPYNNKCAIVNGERLLTGCSATALAQVMYYYKWPKQTTDIIPGNLTRSGIDIPITEIDWDNVLGSYKDEGATDESEEQIEAISSLMQLCVEITASSADKYKALYKCFGYDDAMELVYRDGFDTDSWEDLIYNELENKRPVLYNGYPKDDYTGHAFVIDGYENSYFHVNWGWGGVDSWVLMNEVEGWQGFFYDQNATIGFQPAYPDNLSRYAILENGKMTLYYDKEKKSRSGSLLHYKEWSEHAEEISECVIDPSFANVQPIVLSDFFSNMKNLRTISGIENLNTSKARNMMHMFSGCSSLENLDVTGFRTDNVIMMSEMFKDCSSLTTLDLSNFKTENVGYMDFMFYGCSHLSSLDLSGFRTDNAKSMYGMFTNCSNLTSLDVSSFRTDKVTNMGLMFGFCPNLSSLDLSEFKTDNVTNMLQMFGYCNNLETIYVSDAWNTEKVEMGFSMFDSCYNLVGGAGTLFSQNHTGLDYAHIDGGPSNPGYLTYKESTNIAHTKKITEESGYIYSLSGIKLRSATKGTKGLKPGVYVMGGKKIVVK